MAFSSQDLFDIGGLDSDGRVGFEAQVASRKDRIPVVWPEHYKGPRIESFERGSRLARSWMLMRRAVGIARRKVRAREARETGGMMTVFRAETAADLRAEQLETLRQAADILRRIETGQPSIRPTLTPPQPRTAP